MQQHPITDEEFWQKLKCAKCGEFKFATGFGGETRQWKASTCPDCTSRRERDRHRDNAPDATPSGHWKGAGSASKVYRQRARRFGVEFPELAKAAHKHNAYWVNRRNIYGCRKIDWLVLYYRQGALCGVCRKVKLAVDNTTNIDHDHKTGRVRGLLCHRCNVWMAVVDDPEWYSKGVVYKEGHDAGQRKWPGLSGR